MMADEANHMDKIQQILMDLSGEAAFSGEAMKQFLELKGEVDSQDSTINYLRRELEKGRDMIGDLNSKNAELQKMNTGQAEELDYQHKREGELQDREMQCSVNEVRMECANSRVEDHQSMVGLIFRNTEIRKRVIGQEIVAIPGTPDEIDQFGNRNYGSGRDPEVVGLPIVKDESSSEE
jgi:hypothetical protein